MTDEVELPTLVDAGGLVVYIGFDPTADSLHVGHLQQLCLLRRFQDAGHRPIALVGGGTGMIGDPSQKSEERNLLRPDELEANREAIRAQIAKVLAAVSSSGTESSRGFLLADNAEWLAPARLLDFLRDVGKHFTVNQMIRKDSVRGRLEGREQSLSFTEFSYMLLQAWDFVQLFDRHGCQLQLGGSDQWGNITEGVDLIRRVRGAQAYGLTSPLVTKADGTKFGKTESGSVWLDPHRTSPYEFFQFWLRTSDADVGSYLRRFTFLERRTITDLDIATSEAPERRQAQRALAVEMTTMVHGPHEATKAGAASAVLFTDRVSELDADTLAGALASAPGTPVGPHALEQGIGIVPALTMTGLASSNSDARRALKDRSIYINGVRTDDAKVIGPADALHGRWVILRRGRATQHVITVERVG
jgi:tyrosyl-tRNA synthetase